MGNQGSWTWALALRYSRSSRKDSYSLFLSVVSIGGIALGVCLLILALSALNGLQGALKEEILERTPHLEVELPPGEAPFELRRKMETLEGIEAAQVTLQGPGWLIVGGAPEPVQLVAYEGELPQYFPGLEERTAGVYLPDSFQRDWGLKVGETVQLVSPRPTLTPLGPSPRVRFVEVDGFFPTGRTEERVRVALPLNQGEGFLSGENYRIALLTQGLDQALERASFVEALLPKDARLRTWKELNRPLFFALQVERTALFLGVALIVVVAAMALVSNLALVISAKRRDLGILAALGAPRQSLRRIFLLLGGLLASIGSTLGSCVGVVSAYLLGHYRWIKLPTDVYFLDHLPFQVRAKDVLLVLGMTLVIALVSSLYVTRRLTSFEPVEAMKQ